MRVAGLDSSGDWRFGHGKADHKTDLAAVRQMAQTRLRSFAGDFFLDVRAGIDWIGLLGARNTEDRIRREIVRVLLATPGVLSIRSLDFVVDRRNRHATITPTVGTIYDADVTAGVEVGI